MIFLATVARRSLPGSHQIVLSSGAIAVFYKSTQLVDFDASLGVLHVHREHPRVRIFCKEVERSLRTLNAVSEPTAMHEPSEDPREDTEDEMSLNF